MNEKPISILMGVFGGFLGVDFWGIALPTLGSLVMAFLSGALGYLGVQCVKSLLNRRKKNETEA